MALLIQEYRKRMAELDIKIDALNVQLIQYKTHTLHDSLEKQLRDRFDKFHKDILVKKDKKFFRNKKAF